MARYLLIFLLAFLQVACSASSQAKQKVQRQPLQKSGFALKSPTYEPRVKGYDPKTGNVITYDHKPRIELIDEKAGKYALKWIGYDGKEKTIFYQRHDAVDILVSAAIEKTSDSKYIYIYNVKNLPSSGSNLSAFILQNLSDDAKLITPRQVYIGKMSNRIVQFKEGNWFNFGAEYFGDDYVAGSNAEIRLTSAAPPGLVGCRSYGGPFAMEGVGEEMPSILEAQLPGYNVLPKGFTIGPVDALKSVSTAERTKYVQDRLPQMREAGWITDDAARVYEKALSSNKTNELLNRLDRDLQQEQITTEVAALVRMIKQ